MVNQPGRQPLRELTLNELERFVITAGERKFRAAQVMNGLWRRGLNDFAGMREIPYPLRDHLARNFTLEEPSLAQIARAPDGTRKLALRLPDGEEIESVIIPANGRVTLCLSSQVGCAMGCE
ncbi:MAG: 23S rRNA (adenine(2503)-C(2))-methyltransferase RlmN, partial [Candidatus Binataceae bacterium]